jgi:FAD:protein FMN transferase
MANPRTKRAISAAPSCASFKSIHDKLHAWKPSELNGINRAISLGNAVHIDDEIAHIIRETTEFSVRSQGLFNPAIGHLVQAWGFHRDSFDPIEVDQSQIQALVKAKPEMTDLSVSEGQLNTSNPQVKLDFGGYAKGYALDKAIVILKQHGVKNALINIGGNVIALGKHGDKPWRVGIQHPRKPGAIAALDLESGWAIGTTGDYQRFFMHKGKRYCHVIHPYAGMPVQDMQSVTVLVPPQSNAGAISDMATKPLFMTAPNQQAAMAKQLGIAHVLSIDQQGHIQVTEAMQTRLTWLDHDKKDHIQRLQ